VHKPAISWVDRPLICWISLAVLHARRIIQWRQRCAPTSPDLSRCCVALSIRRLLSLYQRRSIIPTSFLSISHFPTCFARVTNSLIASSRNSLPHLDIRNQATLNPTGYLRQSKNSIQVQQRPPHNHSHKRARCLQS
jgi:hypothetical protein